MHQIAPNGVQLFQKIFRRIKLPAAGAPPPNPRGGKERKGKSRGKEKEGKGKKGKWKERQRCTNAQANFVQVEHWASPEYTEMAQNTFQENLKCR
jgi:hypothetical protein